MKKAIKIFVLTAAVTVAGLAQYPVRPSSLSINNIIRTAPNEATFSVYFKNTATDSAIEYSGGQYHFDFNESILNSGTGTLSIMSSGLPVNLQPTNPTVYITSTPGQLRLAPKAPPGALAGGFLVNPGDSVLVVNLKLTTSASSFSTFNLHNISWRKAPSANPITKVSSYTWDYNQIITGNTSFYIYSSAKELTVTALIEGMFESGAMQNDTLIVELRNAVNFSLTEQTKTYLNSSGIGIANFYSAADAVNYYLAIKHRNGLETWSAAPVSFSGGLLVYDFTTAANTAYGNNLKLKNSKYCVFSGDIMPQDGLIDLTDEIGVINDANNFVSGSNLTTDLNADGSIDLTDIIIVINNANAFISKQTPESASVEKLKRESNSIIN
jgi:hypothetical protein